MYSQPFICGWFSRIILTVINSTKKKFQYFIWLDEMDAHDGDSDIKVV